MTQTKRLDEMPDALSVEELRQVLGIGIHQAYGLVRDGAIRVRKIGRKIIVPREAVREYLAGTDV